MRSGIISTAILMLASCGENQQIEAAVAEATLVADTEDKYKLAAAIAGIAATAEIVRTARALNPQNRPSTKLCCKRCPQGQFPCGDDCRPVGCIPPCLEPPGCACYDSGDPANTPPMQPPLASPFVR